MGIIVGFAIVIAAIMLGGGGIKAFKNFLDVSSILIVIGEQQRQLLWHIDLEK